MLTDLLIKAIKPAPGTKGKKHSDSLGLYLYVTPAGKYWRMNYSYLGTRKVLALGVYPAVSLSSARKHRDKAREQLANGIDPGQVKRQEKLTKTNAAKCTFESVSGDWLVKTKATRQASTQQKVQTWLEKDVYPSLGKMPISMIGPRDVLATLRVMEARGALDSVQRVKQIIGQVFRYAVASGSADRDVTQDLKGALTVAVSGHHPAITEPVPLGALLRSIYGYQGHPTTTAALKLAPQLFVRPGELRTAEWAEVDLETGEWRIPGSKMKMKADHIVPLSTQAVTILRDLKTSTGHGRYVFPSIRTGERPMSENTVNSALRALGYDSDTHTGHGFRATARTIMDEVLGERVDLIEHQLAHAVKDANGRAYNRTAHLPARKDLMQRWSDYLDKLRRGADVIPLRGAA